MKLYKSQAWLHEQYNVQGKSAEEIAAMVGCSKMTIYRYLEKFGMK